MDHPTATAVTAASPVRVLVLVTRAERAGAQLHVRDLVEGLRDRVHFDIAVGEEGFLTEDLRERGFAVHVVEALGREVRPAADVRALRQVVQLIERLSPDVVHTHSSKAGLVGRLAAAVAAVPAVHTAHSWSFSDGAPRARIAYSVPLEMLAARYTDCFIPVSQADEDVGRRYHVIRHHRSRVVHNGVPDVPERADPVGRAVPRIIMVSRMAGPKDHALLLRALAQVQAPFELQLVGDGPYRSALEAQVMADGLSERVTFLGVRQDVPALLAGAQLFTLISTLEGFPLAILEAMRAGLPVLTSDVGGSREAVTAETGVLVPRGSLEPLVAALERLLRNSPLRSRLGAAGRARYEQHFHLDAMLQSTAAVYREVLA